MENEIKLSVPKKYYIWIVFVFIAFWGLYQATAEFRELKKDYWEIHQNFFDSYEQRLNETEFNFSNHWHEGLKRRVMYE